MSLIYTHANALESVNKGKEVLEGLKNKVYSSINTKTFQKPLNQEMADWTKNLESRLAKDSKEHKALNALEASDVENSEAKIKTSDIKATEEQRRIAEDIVKQSQGIINEALEINSSNSSNTDNKNVTIQNTDFLIFVSFGMGEKNIEQLIGLASRYGGVVVLRGLKGGDFKETARFLLKITEKSRKFANNKANLDQSIGIAIDPTLFEEYGIRRVPTYVLAKVCNEGLSTLQCNSQYDKLAGNVSPRYALEKFSIQGDLREEARRRLR